MKKIFVLMLFVMFLGTVARAQQDAFIQSVIAGKEVLEQGERMFQAQGVDCKIDNYYDANRNAIVYEYEFFDKNIFNIFDIENGADGSLDGMLKPLAADPEALMYYQTNIQRLGLSYRYVCIFKGENGQVLRKEATRTTADVIRAISKYKNK